MLTDAWNRNGCETVDGKERRFREAMGYVGTSELLEGTGE